MMIDDQCTVQVTTVSIQVHVKQSEVALKI